MTDISVEIREAWIESPDKKVDLIVRVAGDLEERSATLAERGAEVKRRLRLTGSVAIRCSGRVALALLDESWVERVEPDRPVKALRR